MSTEPIRILRPIRDRATMYFSGTLAEFVYPTTMSDADFAELHEWTTLVLRSIRRTCVKSASAQAADTPK